MSFSYFLSFVIRMSLINYITFNFELTWIWMIFWINYLVVFSFLIETPPSYPTFSSQVMRKNTNKNFRFINIQKCVSLLFVIYDNGKIIENSCPFYEWTKKKWHVQLKIVPGVSTSTRCFAYLETWESLREANKHETYANTNKNSTKYIFL